MGRIDFGFIRQLSKVCHAELSYIKLCHLLRRESFASCEIGATNIADEQRVAGQNLSVVDSKSMGSITSIQMPSGVWPGVSIKRKNQVPDFDFIAIFHRAMLELDTGL